MNEERKSRGSATESSRISIFMQSRTETTLSQLVLEEFYFSSQKTPFLSEYDKYVILKSFLLHAIQKKDNNVLTKYFYFKTLFFFIIICLKRYY